MSSNFPRTMLGPAWVTEPASPEARTLSLSHICQGLLSGVRVTEVRKEHRCSCLPRLACTCNLSSSVTDTVWSGREGKLRWAGQGQHALSLTQELPGLEEKGGWAASLGTLNLGSWLWPEEKGHSFLCPS
jgi:hypothetical protein